MKTNKNIMVLVLLLMMSTVSMAQSGFREFVGNWQAVTDDGTVYVLQINVDNTASMTINGKSTGVAAIRIDTGTNPANVDFVVNDPVTLDQFTMSGIATAGESDNGDFKLMLEYDEGLNRPTEFNSPITFFRQ